MEKYIFRKGYSHIASIIEKSINFRRISLMRKFAKCYPGELSSADQDFDLVGPRRKTKKRALGIQPRALRE